MLGTEVGITKGLAGLGFTNDGTKTTLLGISGDYLRIGDAGTTGHTLASEDDLMVTGKLEVDGAAWFDAAVVMATTLTVTGILTADGYLKSPVVYSGVDNSRVDLQGGTNVDGKGAKLGIVGKDYGGVGSGGYLNFYTPNAAWDDLVSRLLITGGLATAVATWAAVTHSGLDITSGQVLKVAGTQVVGARVVDARCDDVINSGDVTTDGVIDALRDAMITHGLIAAA